MTDADALALLSADQQHIWHRINAKHLATRTSNDNEALDALRQLAHALAENQRLREALTTIVDDCHDAARQGTYKTTDHQSAWRAVGRFARAALAGKEG